MQSLRPHALQLGGLILVAASVLGAYFANSPHAVIEFDSLNNVGTPTYIGTAQALLQGQIFSVGRLPGYPFLLAVLGGADGRYWLILALQAAMFIAVVCVTYLVAVAAFQRRWIAFLLALLVATDIYAAAYSKEILSESMAMTLVAGLMAALMDFVRRPGARAVWVVALMSLLVAFTRSEWLFFPAALGIYFAVWALRQPLPRAVVIHGIAALVACYAVVGAYVVGNAVFNGYPGTSEINNISLLGKVMQYDMQLEAPAEYHADAVVVDRYVNVTHLNVWHVVTENPSFAANHFELSGALARSVIAKDPARFVGLSTRLVFTQNSDIDEPLLHVTAGGPLRLPLRALARYTSARYAANWLLPGLAALWALFPLVYRRPHPLKSLGPIALVAMYGTVIVAFGGFDEYGRYHTVFMPATVMVVWGTLLFNVQIASGPKRGLGPLTAGMVAAELVAIVLMTRFPDASLAAILSVAALAAQALVVGIWLRSPADSVPI